MFQNSLLQKSPQSAIQVHTLTHNFGDIKALDRISFDVPSGSLCGLIGPNGSGKTTTLRILLGLIRPDQCKAEILGNSIYSPQSYLKFVGALIESPALYPTLSARDNLKFFAKLGKLPEHRIDWVLNFVGLSSRSEEKVKNYSLGMKQRLGLALALLPKPELLILDEPTNGLDPAGILEIRELLRKLTKQGVTVFVSSHLLSEVEQICDYMVLLKAGQVIFSGAMTELQMRIQSCLTLEPEHPSDIPLLCEMITQLGYKVEKRHERVVVYADRTQGAKINKAAASVGISLNAIEVKKQSLEESFFQMLTEGSEL